MSDETRQDQRTRRSMTVFVYGTDATSLELAALDDARQFFGADVQLEVMRDYIVCVRNDTAGRRYMSYVTVREV